MALLKHLNFLVSSVMSITYLLEILLSVKPHTKKAFCQQMF